MFIINTEDESLAVADIYAPTQDHPALQMSLIDLIEDRIVSMETDHILLGGDFNLCANPTMDKIHQRDTPSQGQRTMYADRVASFPRLIKTFGRLENCKPYK